MTIPPNSSPWAEMISFLTQNRETPSPCNVRRLFPVQPEDAKHFQAPPHVMRPFPRATGAHDHPVPPAFLEVLFPVQPERTSKRSSSCPPAFPPRNRGTHAAPSAVQSARPAIDPYERFAGFRVGFGEGKGTLLEKRPPSPGLASPEARYHAHVRSSPDCGICP